jgi:hypothetical protein
LNPVIVVDQKITTKRLSEQIRGCSSEEDLRINMEFVLREAIPDLPIPKYEQAIKTSTFHGRADAVHHGLVIEYEKPRTLRKNSAAEHALQQLWDYLTGLSLPLTPEGAQPKSGPGADQTRSLTQEQEERLAAHVGVATDGETFIFTQRKGKQWHVDRRKLDEDTVEKLLLWLKAMVRKDLSPNNLIADFGPETELATSVVSVFAKLVNSEKHPKANVMYEEWRRIFGIVYGTEQLERSGKAPEVSSLFDAYHVHVGAKFPVILFAVHTYYALLMKMLATEVIVAQGGLGDTFIGALARTSLLPQLQELESGDILQRHNIRNAIEQDFFGWYTAAWTSDVQDVLWRMSQTLSSYDIGTFELKPDRARDLLKDLYHGLIPEAVRHALGEYYTPDWLAEHTIELAGFDGNPRKALLDPSCGSGTFLLMAIQKVRRWLSDRTVEWGSSEQKRQAVNLIRHNIVGFDLNPLAVIASRTNYLFALGPLLRYRSSGSDFEIPVYLTDSVLLPGKTPAQQDLFAQETVAFPMTVGTFELPIAVVDNRQVPDLMNMLHEAIVDGHSRNSFVSRAIQTLHLSGAGPQEASLGKLFDVMKKLDLEGKNRVWAKLIRNRYAALFFRHYFDFVVGNPPHVNWEALTHDWRKAAEAEYKHYGLFTLKGNESRHGGGKKDIAALFTYAVLDHFLKDDGVLALIAHVSLFKATGAGEGFRRFQLGDNEHFCVNAANDFASFQPFQAYPKMKIKTRTLTFRAIKGKQTKYPVPYQAWSKTVKGFFPGELSWEEAQKRLVSHTLKAVPLRGTTPEGRLSPWLTISTKQLRLCRKVIAPPGYQPAYEGHAGIYTGGLNGAFFLEVLDRHPDGTMLVRNIHDVGKIECPKVQTSIEGDLVYPLLRGRSMGRWWAKPEEHILVLQNRETQKGYDEDWLQRTHPLAWAFIRKFEKPLRERKLYKKFFDPDKDPFYSMYFVADYTFHPHKVAWMDVSATMKAVVLPEGKGNDLMIPEHKVMFLTTKSAEEAHYVAAVLNSEPVGTVISGYIVDNSVSTHPVDNIVIPRFDPKNTVHEKLLNLSKACHLAAKKEDATALAASEKLITETVQELWSD